jgi:hypothetical protein
MWLFDAFNDWAKNLKTYLLGRGFLSLAVILAGVVTNMVAPGSTLITSAVVAFGGALFNGVMRLKSQEVYENNMIELYRDDIAREFGIAPGDVTRSHLHEAAKTNDVIDQALKRQSHRNWVNFGTSALAAIATFGLINVGILDMGKELFSNLPWGLDGVAQFLTMGSVAGFSSLVLHSGLEFAIDRKTGLDNAAAHDRILELERGMGRGWGISKEQVYSVLVAGNPSVQSMIAQQFGADYARMRPTQQAQVLEEIGVADAMQAIATEINHGRMRPAHLAYMMNDAMPRDNRPREDAAAPQKSFVKALGRAAQHDARSFAERVDAQRTGSMERAL